MKRFSTSERLKEYMQNHNLRQVDILEKAKPYSDKYKIRLNKNDLSQYVSGKVEPGQDKILILSKALGVDPAWIMGLNVPEKYEPVPVTEVPYNKVPFVGTIAAGQPLLAEEHIEGYFNLDSRIKADFCLKIKGDSMINAGINEGDIVFIRKQSDIENGQIGAVLVEDVEAEATLKRIYKDNSSITLVSENPKYPPKIFTDGNIQILGKLSAVLNVRE